MSPPLPVLRCSSSGARRPLLPANVAADPRRLPGHMTAVAPRPVALWDPDWFLGDDVHRTFAESRRTDPMHWQDMPGEAGFWAVLRYADAVEVARQPERYSSWRGGIMLEDVDAERLELTRRMLLVMDAPQHTAYRQPLAPHFGARVIGRMEEQIRDRC